MPRSSHLQQTQTPHKDTYIGREQSITHATLTQSTYSLEDLLDASLAQRADEVAMTTCLPNGADADINYQQLWDSSLKLAHYLREDAKLNAGDVVAIQAPNTISAIICLISVLRAGLVATSINPLYTAPETRRQLRDSGAKVLIGSNMFAETIEAAVAKTDIHTVIQIQVTDFFPAIKRAVLDTVLHRVKRLARDISIEKTNVTSLRAILKSKASLATGTNPYKASRPRTADALLQYTGGTTGNPKGVRLTEATLMTAVQQLSSIEVEAFHDPKNALLLVLPTYHVFGLISSLLTLKAGGRLILAPSPKPLTNLRPAFEKYEPAIFPGVNGLFSHLCDEDWFKALPNKPKVALSGATALHPSVYDKWTALTGGSVMEAYGMTETNCAISFNPPGRYKSLSAGIALPGTGIRIVDDKGQPLAQGAVGEVEVTGPQLMAGYAGRPEETAAVFNGDWLRTGDMGYLDEDSYLFLVDRKKDMVLVGGFNVYPSEIEAVLLDMPGIEEAAIVGKQDDEGNESLQAFLKVAEDGPDEEAIRAHISANLTAYKRPRSYTFMDELPKSIIGKVLRKDLRI